MASEIIENLSASLAPVVAIVGVGIGFLQLHINKKRYTHELFDRRFAMFQAIQIFIGDVLADSHAINDDFRKLYLATNGAGFIFDVVIKDYIKLLIDNANELNKAVGEADTDQVVELSEWFLDQFDESEKMFHRYLGL